MLFWKKHVKTRENLSSSQRKALFFEDLNVISEKNWNLENKSIGIGSGVVQHQRLKASNKTRNRQSAFTGRTSN